MRSDVVSTMVRPIRKVIIIEPNDFASFTEIVKQLSREICGIRTVILLNDEQLFTENTKAFVECHDPDIVINYSTSPCEELHKHLNRFVTSSKEDNFNLAHYGALLGCQDNDPNAWIYGGSGKLPYVIGNFNSGDGERDVFRMVHCGLLVGKTDKLLASSIYGNVDIIQADSVVDVLQAVQQRSSFLNLSIPEFWISSQSIYERNWNPAGYFTNTKRACIVGKASDMKSIVFFWNIRATYPRGENLWMPVELLREARERVAEYQHFVLFGQEAKKAVENMGIKYEEIPNGVVNFDWLAHDDWRPFEHYQVVNVIDNKATVVHPNSKMFSTTGAVGAYMLEVRGLDEALFPHSAGAGKLFVPNRNRAPEPYVPTRVGRGQLSIYRLHLRFFDMSGDRCEITIPEFHQLVREYFWEHGYTIEVSDKSFLLERLVALIGGPSGLNIVANQKIHDLIKKMAPKRVERLAHEISEDLQGKVPEEEIRECLRKSMDQIPTVTTELMVDMDGMLSCMSVKSNEREDFIRDVQELYNRGVFLRGKKFTCPSCGSILWYPLEKLEYSTKCYCCNAAINIPISEVLRRELRALSDYYRLNELVVRGVDQGQLSTILAMNAMQKQGYPGTRFVGNLNARKRDTEKILTDIDLVIGLGRRLGLAEVKGDGGFDEEQAKILLSTGADIGTDFFVFACLKSREGKEISEFTDFLKKQQLTVPAFVLGKEVLLGQRDIRIGEYFERSTVTNEFPRGPFIL